MDGTNFQVVSKLKVLCKGRPIQIMRKSGLNNDTALIKNITLETMLVCWAN